MREDFCSAFALCCEWVRRNKDNRAYGIDLDIEPLDLRPRTHYLIQASPRTAEAREDISGQRFNRQKSAAGRCDHRVEFFVLYF